MLTELRDATNETAFVSSRSGWFAYLVELAETAHPVRLQFHRGQAFPLHVGAGARLLLSSLSHDGPRRLLRSDGRGSQSATDPNC